MSETRTRRPRDMALSLAVLLVPLFLLVAGYNYLFDGEKAVTVDPANAVASAHRAGVPALSATPPGWLVVSAQFSEGVLRVGYLTPAEKGVLLIQAKQEMAKNKIAKDDEIVLTGKSGDLWVFVVGPGGELEPLAKSLPVTLTAMP